MSRHSLKWIPLAVVPAAVVAAAIAVPMQAGAATSNASAGDVVAMALKSNVTTFSGTVKQTSDLGLPDVSGLSLGGSSSSGASSDQVSQAMELVTGSHTARVYSDGASKQRVQVIDSMAERDVVRNGSTVWLWDSKAKKATHVTLPSKSSATPRSTEITKDPAALAKKFLAAAGDTTTVSLGDSVSVAGRDAYDLVMKPKAAGTLVGSVHVAVDEKSGQPLEVSVTAKGAKSPAFEVGFTTLDLSAPSSSLFDFTAPKGATVKNVTPHAHGHHQRPTADQIAAWKAAHPDQAAKWEAEKAARAAQRPAVSGTGWASIVTVPASDKTASAVASKQVQSLTTPVAGGRVLSTTLVTVLITDDGRVLAGSVPASALEAAAATAK